MRSVVTDCDDATRCKDVPNAPRALSATQTIHADRRRHADLEPPYRIARPDSGPTRCAGDRDRHGIKIARSGDDTSCRLVSG